MIETIIACAVFGIAFFLIATEKFNRVVIVLVAAVAMGAGYAGLRRRDVGY